MIFQRFLSLQRLNVYVILLFGQTDDVFIVSELRCDLTLFWGNACSFHGLYVKVDCQSVHCVLMSTDEKYQLGRQSCDVYFCSLPHPSSFCDLVFKITLMFYAVTFLQMPLYCSNSPTYVEALWLYLVNYLILC